MGLLLHEYSCNSFVAMIAKDLEHPPNTKLFWGFFLFKH